MRQADKQPIAFHSTARALWFRAWAGWLLVVTYSEGLRLKLIPYCVCVLLECLCIVDHAVGQLLLVLLIADACHDFEVKEARVCSTKLSRTKK
jgi:hypothetical protein